VFELIARGRQLLDPHRLRREANRRRRLIAAVLAGLGVLFVIASLRPAPPTLAVDTPASSALFGDEVAVPILIRPAAIAGALEPGMVVDVVALEQPLSLLAEGARVLRLPGGGFGPTSEAVAVLAVPQSEGVRLASQATNGVGVIIRPTEP
jgi:hypothetical protein